MTHVSKQNLSDLATSTKSDYRFNWFYQLWEKKLHIHNDNAVTSLQCISTDDWATARFTRL